MKLSDQQVSAETCAIGPCSSCYKFIHDRHHPLKSGCNYLTRENLNPEMPVRETFGCTSQNFVSSRKFEVSGLIFAITSTFVGYQYGTLLCQFVIPDNEFEFYLLPQMPEPLAK